VSAIADWQHKEREGDEGGARGQLRPWPKVQQQPKVYIYKLHILFPGPVRQGSTKM